MPYFQAAELLRLKSTNIEELLNALEDLGIEYGHIKNGVQRGSRVEAEADLIRIIILAKSIKYRIIELFGKNHDRLND